ncbi:MAG: hypothetical protein WBB01_19885 [Phormidesmis sp.]
METLAISRQKQYLNGQDYFPQDADLYVSVKYDWIVKGWTDELRRQFYIITVANYFEYCCQVSVPKAVHLSSDPTALIAALEANDFSQETEVILPAIKGTNDTVSLLLNAPVYAHFAIPAKPKFWKAYQDCCLHYQWLSPSSRGALPQKPFNALGWSVIDVNPTEGTD